MVWVSYSTFRHMAAGGLLLDAPRDQNADVLADGQGPDEGDGYHGMAMGAQGLLLQREGHRYQPVKGEGTNKPNGTVRESYKQVVAQLTYGRVVSGDVISCQIQRPYWQEPEEQGTTVGNAEGPEVECGHSWS